MGTKKARDLKKGDKIKLTDGTFVPVTHVRAMRISTTVQYEAGNRVSQGDFRSDIDVEVLP